MLLSTENAFFEAVFLNEGLILYIFSFMLLLYVAAVIYNRIKRPKNKTIVKVHAKVLSVNQARAQTNHRDVGFDGLMSGGAAIPGARFDATFINEENDETYVFTISESISNQLSVGKAGVLCFKGDEFISFGEEEEQKKIEKRFFIRKRVLPWTVAGILVIGLIVGVLEYYYGSDQRPDYMKLSELELENRPLTVYMSAHMTQSNGELTATSRYSLGDFRDLVERWGESYDSYHLYYDAVQEYKKSTGRDVEIVYFTTSADLLRQAHEEWKLGIGPDVVIGDYSNVGCELYPYISDGKVLDLMPYMEADETYSSNEYITEVLEAGRIGEEQLVFPLTFTMNMLYTSEERMEDHSIWFSEDMTYDDMLNLFAEEWDAVRDEDEYLMIQFTNIYRNRFPLFLFQSASGVNMIDHETGKILLEKEDFYEWARLYESYVCDEYQMSREELKKYVVENPESSMPANDSKFELIIKLMNGESNYSAFELTKEDVLCWVDGGGVSIFYHPFAANAAYYESRLTENEETFVPMAIPSKQSADEYVAEITTFGLVWAESRKAEEAYEFVKALADNEHFMHFDLSVNRQMLNNTLDDLANTKYRLDLAATQIPQMKQFESSIVNTESEEYEPNDLSDEYTIQPISAETKQYLLDMVDQIGVACLPDGKLDLIVFNEIGEYIWGGTDSIEEAYDNTIKQFIERGYIE